MKWTATFAAAALSAALCAAPTANEDFVVAEAAAAYSNAVYTAGTNTDAVAAALSAAKQDKLPYSTNAIPQGVISGLSTALAGKLDKTGGEISGDLSINGRLYAHDSNGAFDFSGGSLYMSIGYPEDGGVFYLSRSNGELHLYHSGETSDPHGDLIFPYGEGTLALTSDIPDVSAIGDDATNYTDSASAALSAADAVVARDATNYTDSAIGAAIAPANPTFSEAVLSVGLGIDTNAVAVLNEIAADFGGFPLSPGSTATTVGGLLAALAAAIAWLKKNKADASALRYAMPESVELVAENDAATLVCADRAVTNATIASGFATLNLTFPAEVSGYVRDFYLRITVAAGESAPALSLPQGITIENAGGAVPEIADGEASAAATTLVWFSETAPGIFTAKSETVKAVA